MKQNAKSRLASLVLISSISMLALSACTFLRLARASKLKQPTFAFLDSRFQKADERQADFQFDLSAFNPNAIGLKNVTVGYELFYEDKRFLHGQDIAMDLKPKDTTRILIPASVVYREVFDVAGPVTERLLLNHKTFPMRVDAVIAGKPTLYDDKEEGGLFSFTLHVSRTVDVPIPQGLLDKAKSTVRGALRKMF